MNCTCRLRNINGGDGPFCMAGTRDRISFSFGSVPCMRSSRPSFGVDRKTGSSIAASMNNIVVEMTSFFDAASR